MVWCHPALSSVLLLTDYKKTNRCNSFHLSHVQQVLLITLWTASWFFTQLFFLSLFSLLLFLLLLSYTLSFILNCLVPSPYCVFIVFHVFVFLCCLATKRISSCGTIKMWTALFHCALCQGPHEFGDYFHFLIFFHSFLFQFFIWIPSSPRKLVVVVI